jgi:hypothetical protein
MASPSEVALLSLASDSYGDFLRRSEETQQMAARFYRTARAAARLQVPLLAAGNVTTSSTARKPPSSPSRVHAADARSGRPDVDAARDITAVR